MELVGFLLGIALMAVAAVGVFRVILRPLPDEPAVAGEGSRRPVAQR